MAGSFNHLVGKDDALQLDLIENLGDAAEAFEECYQLIFYLAGDDKERIAAACDHLNIVNPWDPDAIRDDE